MGKAPLSQTLVLTEDGSAVTLSVAVDVPPTVIVTPAPTFTTQPSITGTPQVGQALSALTYNDGVVTNGNITARAYLLAGAAKTAAYVLQAGDVGAALTIQATATGPGGTVTATSAAVVVAAAASFAPAVLTRTTASGTNPPQFDMTTGDAQIGVHSFRLVQTKGIGGAAIASETVPFDSDFALSYEDADGYDWASLGVVSGGGLWASYIDTLLTSTGAVVATSNTITDTLANVANPTSWSATDHSGGLAFPADDGRRTITRTAGTGGALYGARGDQAYNTGKWRLELTLKAYGSATGSGEYPQFGLITAGKGIGYNEYFGYDTSSLGNFMTDGKTVWNGTETLSIGGLVVNDVLTYDFDADANTVKVMRNGNASTAVNVNVANRSGPLSPACLLNEGTTAAITAGTTPPTGYKHWGNP